jgi:transcriptional regulator with XRE-family HTH domain
MQKTFGQIVKERRVMLGLTQAQLADLIGISRRQINLYESDGAVPRDLALHKLAKALNVSADQLIGKTQPDGAYMGTPLVKDIFAQNDFNSGYSYFLKGYAPVILLNHPNSIAVENMGDALSPYYETGDILLIDKSEGYTTHHIGKNALYLVCFSEPVRAVIKHVYKSETEEVTTLWTPNSNYPPTIVYGDVCIVGRVIGSIQ